VIAGFIVYAELGEMVRRLTENPGVRSRLTEEIRTSVPSGALTLPLLAGMPYLLQVVNEVKRLCPIVAAVFGKARREFIIDGVSIPAGWMVMWAIRPSHVAHGVYTDPERFDPDRFSPERAEQRRHEHAFVARGPRKAIAARVWISRRISWKCLPSFSSAAIRGIFRRRGSR
jgi:cytochrome P450